MQNSVNNIRKNFLNYFAKNNHEIISSSPLIPKNDPSLMFVNAGMNQFKDIFTGKEQAKFLRAASSQKCVRAGGKHNDLENVGYTARHHTFFEMLGNFSFGDYFKEEAIYYAWRFLTEELGLSKDKLYITIYHTDDEAHKLWRKISGFSDDRIIKIATKDNFWSMGDLGPCGPCSEIFYDHGEHIFGGLPGTKNEDGDRFIEIWNMVFMQYEQLENERIKLPNACIDTGMGIERIAAVLQGKHNNYEIDLFDNIIKNAEDNFSVKVTEKNIQSYRVIADHLRAMSFLITDGVMSSNEGRGYVLRRIMRRAMRHANLLGANKPIIYNLVDNLIANMGEAYPELVRAESLVKEIIQSEENRFLTTLNKGLKILETELEATKTNIFSGQTAFKLYDTYGFPLDLTEDILKSKNISVDKESFSTEMQKQKDLARQAWSGSGEKQISKIWHELEDKFGATEFLGYLHSKSEAKIQAILVDGELIDEVTEGKFQLLTNQTPFYAESGGQMGDVGEAYNNNCRIKILDTKKQLGKLHIHECELIDGKLSNNENITLEINDEYRAKLKANHSATHILHAVLKELLGDHVVQKGSLVASDKLRFDFSHTKAVTAEQLKLIERKVNEIILQNKQVSTKLMDTEQAISEGAQALFGEKYAEQVRVVAMGCNPQGATYSLELCGGTHVASTGDIGMFKITSESAIAAGARRIEAVTHLDAVNYVNNLEQKLDAITSALNVSDNEILDKINNLQADKKLLEKENQQLKHKAYNITKTELENNSHKLAKFNLLIKKYADLDPKTLRLIAEDAGQKLENQVNIIVSENQGKVAIIVTVSNNLIKEINAGLIAKEVSILLGGKGGGGKPNLAQAGGDSLENFTKIKDLVENL